MLLALLAACITPTQIPYTLPDGCDHVSLRGADVKLNGESLGDWSDAKVNRGIYSPLYQALEERNAKEVEDYWSADHPPPDDKMVFFELPDDTPGHILPILFGTAAHAGHGEFRIGISGSPAVVGPIGHRWVEQVSDDCPDKTLPDPAASWLPQMQKNARYGIAFDRAFAVQNAGEEHQPVTLVRECVPKPPGF